MRTRRCDTTQLKDAATRYGSTPMSTNRNGTATALGACSAASTNRPAMAAPVASASDSDSSISSTRTASGSLCNTSRSAAGKLSPASSSTSSCLTPSTLYAMGSSTEERLRSGVHRSHRGVERRRRPEPAGPLTTTRPRLADRVGVPRPLVVGEAEHLDVRDAALTVERPGTHESSCAVGRMATRTSIRALDADREAAFAGHAGHPSPRGPSRVDQRTQRRHGASETSRRRPSARNRTQLVGEGFDAGRPSRGGSPARRARWRGG